MEDERYIAIGASGGEGLSDIRELLAALPANTPAIFMVVLHRPVHGPTYLQNVLSRRSNMPVVIAGHGQKLQESVVYIGEPDSHLTLLGQRAGMIDDDPCKHHNRTIDLLFKSLAEHAGASAIGVVLSGSLDDGSRGLAAIHNAQGVTMVLTPLRGANIRHGMPENAIDFNGPINVTGSPPFIAHAITQILAEPNWRGKVVQ